jgi:hypothetical protein
MESRVKFFSGAIRVHIQTQVNLLSQRSRRVNRELLREFPIHCLPISVDEGALVDLRLSRAKHNSGDLVQRKVREQVVHSVQMTLPRQTKVCRQKRNLGQNVDATKFHTPS